MRRYKALDILPLAENEVHIKDYHCSELSFPECAGFLRVTNQRIIFYGFPLKKTSLLKSIFRELLGIDTKIDLDFSPANLDKSPQARIVNETQLKGVNSISSFYGTKILIKTFILAWIIGIAAVIGTVRVLIPLEHLLSTAMFVLISITGILIMFLLLTLAIFIGIGSFRKVFSLQIFGASAHDPISIGEGYHTLLGADKVYSIIARPSEHTDEMMLEVGTLIFDLQNMGDIAIAKWHEKWEKQADVPIQTENPISTKNKEPASTSKKKDP